jgi:hypothetical protein
MGLFDEFCDTFSKVEKSLKILERADDLISELTPSFPDDELVEDEDEIIEESPNEQPKKKERK